MTKLNWLRYLVNVPNHIKTKKCLVCHMYKRIRKNGYWATVYIGGNINVHIWTGLGYFIYSRREIRYSNNLVKNVVPYFVSILVLQSS